MTNRNYDLDVARLLGLDVLGEAPCLPGYCKDDHWGVSYDGSGSAQPVYLQNCVCDDPLEDEISTLGHVVSCLEVVPFYHQSDTLARQALEQICDERICVASLIRTFNGVWIVELYTAAGDKTTRGRDESFSLAICKALAM